MATKIEELESKSILLGGKLEYAQRLIATLGNPSEWEYRGECNDNRYCTSTCACGHEGIRYEFPIYHKSGRREIIGSTCICHFHLISPETAEKMAESYDKVQRELRKAEAERKKVIAMKEVQELIEKFNTLRKKAQDIYDAIKENGKKAPGYLWSICGDFRPLTMDGQKLIRKYKRPCDMKKVLKQKIQGLEHVVNTDYSTFLEKEDKANEGNDIGRGETEPKKETIMISGVIGPVELSIESETPKAFLLRNQFGDCAWIPRKALMKKKDDDIYQVNGWWKNNLEPEKLSLLGY